MTVGVAIGLIIARAAWPARSIDPLGPGDVDPDDVRDVACSLTAPSGVCDPSDPDPPDPPDLPDPPDPAAAGLLSNLVLLLLVLLLAAGLAFLIMRFVRGDRSAGEDDVDETELDEHVEGVLADRIVDDDSPPAAWRARAEEHAARGEFRDAIRCRYRALVGDLARAGYVDEIPGRTSGEERAQVAQTAGELAAAGADAAGVTSSFDVAATTFDVAWFDDRPVASEDHARFVVAERVVLDAMVAGPSRRRSTAGVGS